MSGDCITNISHRLRKETPMRIPGVPTYDDELHDRIEENFKVIRLCMQLTEPEFGALIGIGKLRVQQITLGEKELLEELVKLDVTPEQLKEAKNLQRKLFVTFESVDDKSQEYSESMETLNEMSKPLIPVLGYALAVAPAGITALLAWKKGGAFFVDKITSFLAKHTKILNGKFATKL